MSQTTNDAKLEETNDSKITTRATKPQFTVVKQTVITHDDEKRPDTSALAKQLEKLALQDPELLKEWNELNGNTLPHVDDYKQSQHQLPQVPQLHYTILDYNPPPIKSHTISAPQTKDNSLDTDTAADTEAVGNTLDPTEASFDPFEEKESVPVNPVNNAPIHDIQILDSSENSINIVYKLIKIEQFSQVSFGAQLIIYPRDQISIWLGIVNPSKSSNDSDDSIKTNQTDDTTMIPALNNLFLSLPHRKRMHNDIGNSNVSTVSLILSKINNETDNNNNNMQNRMGGNMAGIKLDCDDFSQQLSRSLVQLSNKKYSKSMTFQVSCDIPNQVLSSTLMSDKPLNYGGLINDRNNDIDYEMIQQYSTIGMELEKAMVDILKEILNNASDGNNISCKDNQSTQNCNNVTSQKADTNIGGDDDMIIVD